MDSQQAARLASFVGQGRVILFTGAGFSVGARSKSGSTLPTAHQLTQALWDVAFPNDDFEDSALPDVFEAALRQASTKTQQVVTDLLTVDPQSLDDGYKLWLSFPWHRIYTLNIDSLADAANLAFDLPRPLRTLSALTDPAPPAFGDDVLDVIHLNGTLNDLPNVTFSNRQYAERLARPDLWYRNLTIELQTQPVLYVGTTLEEPSLWTYIEGRGHRNKSHETRPGSFLVTKDLAKAKQVSLGTYNVSWVEATAEEFASSVLTTLGEEADEGRRAIERRRQQDQGGPPIVPISDIQDDHQNDEREFLRGREPRWSDITTGYAVSRAFDKELNERFLSDPARLIILTGTAGSGKSTSAMRLALTRASEGDRVSVLSLDAANSLHEIRRTIKAESPEILLIDNADRFGRVTATFLQEVLEENTDLRIVACVRSTNFQTLNSIADLGLFHIEHVVPELCDDDVDALLDALDEANRLGVLKGKTRKQQREAMEKKFGRQLLVALLEVTQGVRFEQKIESECADLKGDAPLLYAVAALSVYTGGPLSDQEMYVAAGDATAAKEQIDLLTSRHLLVRNASGRLMPRHRVVAERIVRYYQGKGIIAQVCTALATGLASGAHLDDLRANRTGRILIRLLKHDNLIRLVYRGNPIKDRADVRAIYDSVEGLLRDDYHYLLQRGSFETEEGDLEQAKLYLDQARAMAPDDHLVRAEWSYMTLKRATESAGEVGASDEAQTAFDELEDLIETRGEKDEYVFHIYGNQGLNWVAAAPLGFQERKALLERLERVVKEGRKLHPASEYLSALGEKVQNRYLSLAVRTDDPSQLSL
jgi:tetratricopeptide (TPR) repeat protein